MMDPTWSLLRRRFDEAIDLPPDERRGFVESLEADDPALAARLAQLLEAVDASDGRLEPPIVDLRQPDEFTPAPGTWIGGYRLVRKIATGGMGVVFEAEQRSPRRRVALKMLRYGFDSPGAVRRFRDEAEVLARLRHPGIAQVFESGVHRDQDGSERPWFAMEFVDGACDLVTYCNRNRLTREQRVRLFAEICDAVQHGHQRGTVHRDLKPANILVDSNDRPKVIDFGVARTTGSDRQCATLARTRDEIVGTLRYMSPEQLEGRRDAVDTRTDVYSLGVVLFEVLTGRHPHDLEGRSMLDVARIVRDEPPIRPSRLDVDGDLEWILLKALAKEPAHRYATVAEFAEETRRFLRHETIAARPPSLGYQIRSLARRHRALVASATFGGAALLAAAIVSTTFWFESAAAREREAARADEAESVTRFVVRFLEQGNPVYARGDKLDPLAFFDSAAATLDAEVSERPAVRARLAATIGEGLLWLGDLEGGDALLRKAIAWREPLSGDDEEVLHWRLVRARGALWRRDFDHAESACRDALARLRPEHPTFLLARATAMLGSVAAARGRMNEAEELLRSGVEIARRRDVDPIELAGEMELLGMFLRDRRRSEEAEPILMDALAYWDKRYPGGHIRTLELRRALALCARDLGDLQRSASILDETLADAYRLVGPEHGRTTVLLVDRAGLATRQGRTEAAREDLERAIAIERRVRGPDHPLVGWSAHDLAVAWIMAGRPERAVPLLADAERIYRAHYPDGHAHLAIVLATMADLAAQLRDFERAATLVEEADAMRERFDAGDRLGLGGIKITRAEIAIGRQDGVSAERFLRDAIEILGGFPDSRSRLGTAHVMLARNLNLRGDAEAAEVEARAGLRAFDGQAPTRRAGFGHLNLGWALAQQGRHAAARAEYRSALAMFREVLPELHLDLAWPLDHLGIELLEDAPPESVELLTEAVAIRSAHLPASDPAVLGTMLSLAKAHRRAGDLDAGEALLNQARDTVSAAYGDDHRYAGIVAERLAELAADRERARRDGHR